MKLDIDGIQAFVAISRLGSFQKAADSLQLTQTALTRRIQRLEAYLQVVLLERTTRSVSLTTERAIGLIKRRAASLSPAAQALYDILALELGALHAKND